MLRHYNPRPPSLRIAESPLPTPSPTPHSDLSRPAQIALQHVSEQQKVDQSQLLLAGEETVTFPILGYTYTLVTVFHDQPGAFQSFSILVDPVTGKIDNDYNNLRAAESAAYRTKYGKFDPNLYERLQKIGDEEQLPVAIWVTPSEKVRSEAELASEFIKLHPEGEAALREHGVPWLVDDVKLQGELQMAWRQMQLAEQSKGTEPVVEWLKAQGYEGVASYGYPSVTATINKRDILLLAQMENVDQLYLIEAEAKPASDIAIPTDRISAVWARGVSGAGVARMAIVETGKINAQASPCLNIVGERKDIYGNSFPDNVHKSRVAAIAACNDQTLRGVAYGVEMLDAASTGAQVDTKDALVWAIGQTVDVVNESGHFTPTDTLIQYMDRVYDFHVRNSSFTAVIAAGNEGNDTKYVTTPAKAWNVIAVGNVDDHNTASWGDDNIYATSSYVNPDNGVEKPEVAAPGVKINTVAGEGPIPGTSYSAPQVAGLAALLMNHNSNQQLQFWPSAVKAIIMAAAVHNIEGNRNLSSKDGAGAIDAALADQTVQTVGIAGTPCNAPCWWYINTSSSSPIISSTVDRSFSAMRGERIRVAISWLAQADSSYNTDALKTNYDLIIRHSINNSIVISSVSVSNNYEIVEFVAPISGQYKLEVFRSATGDQNEASNKLGIAWTKQATYLPDVRNDGTWTSKIYIRNDGALQRQVRVSYFNNDGGTPGSAESNIIGLPSDGMWYTATLPTFWSGSAIVDGSEDISVLVETLRNDNSSATNYSGIPTLDSNGTVISKTLYLPSIKYSYLGRTGKITIMNASPVANTVNVSFKRSDTGNAVGSCPTISLAVGARQTVQPSDCGLPSTNGQGTPWIYAATLTASQPIAAIAIEEQDSGGLAATTTAFASGRSVNYAPLVKSDFASNRATVVVQNVGTAATDVTVTYYDRDDTDTWSPPVFNLQAGASRVLSPVGIVPTSTLASGVISSNNGQPLVTVIYESKVNGDWRMQHSGYLAGSRTVSLPHIYKNYVVGAYTWQSAIQIQNVGTANANVTVYYYDATTGTTNAAWNQGPTVPGGSIAPNETATVNIQNNNPNLPSPFHGSAVILSDQPIVASINVPNNNGTGDASMSYSGVNR